MRAGWNTHPLGELCRIEIGGTPSRSSAKYWDKEKATSNVWLSIADMPKTLHASISRSSEHLSDGGAERVKIVRAGTLLVSFKLTLGRLAYAGTDLRTNEAIAALSLLENSRIKKEFLYWYLTFFDWQKAAEGEEKVKGKTLNKAKLSCIPVLVPPIPEQLRIVAILDEAFAGIATVKANTEKCLRNARELLAIQVSRILSASGDGWAERSLVEICVVDWGNTSLTKSSYIEDGKYLAVSAAGCDGRIAHMEHAKHTPVLSAIGAQCGRMFFPDEDFTAIKNTITLTPREGICSGRFLFHLLTHVELPKRGAAQPFMAKGDIQAFRVLVPSRLDEQKVIAGQIDALEAEAMCLEVLYTRKLAALDELKQSLLQQAFSGQL